MKKFFSSPFGKRLVVGLIFIAVAVVLGIALDGIFTGPNSLVVFRFIYVICVVGLGLGGIVFIFLGWYGFWGSIGFVSVVALPKCLPEPWNRYFAFLYFASLLGLPPLLGWLRGRKKTASPPEITIPESEEADTWKSCSLIPNSIVVLNNPSGRVYQLVYKSGRLYGYWIGRALKGIDESKLQTHTSRSPSPSPHFIYSRDEIRSVKERAYGEQTSFILRAKGHTYQFLPYGISTEDEIDDFFQRLLPDPQPKTPVKKPVGSTQKRRRARLRQLRTGLFIATGAIALPWLFLDVPYKVFSILSLLPFPITLATICLFPEDITLEDQKTHKKNSDNKIEFNMLFVFSGVSCGLRTMLDFNFLTWMPLLIQAGLLLVTITILLLIFHKELRQRIGILLCIILICAFSCIGTIGQLNYLLDTSEPQQQVATISDMHISTSSKGPDDYILTVITESGKKMELKTSKERYDSLSVGEAVTVYIREGGLGIPYAIAK